MEYIDVVIYEPEFELRSLYLEHFNEIWPEGCKGFDCFEEFSRCVQENSEAALVLDIAFSPYNKVNFRDYRILFENHKGPIFLTTAMLDVDLGRFKFSYNRFLYKPFDILHLMELIQGSLGQNTVLNLNK